jgi:hypothetical protein
MSTRTYRCPSCKAKAGVTIIYGFPSPTTFEKADRNEVVIGGCVIEDDAPDRQCTSCGHQWLIKRRGCSSES